MDFTAHLPDDILATIFSWLNTPLRFALLPIMCKRWQHVFGSNSICWQVLDLRDIKRESLGVILRSINSQWTGAQPPSVKRLFLCLPLHRDSDEPCRLDGRCILPTEVFIAPLMKWRSLVELHVDASFCAAFFNLFIRTCTLKLTQFPHLRKLLLADISYGERELDLSAIQSPYLDVLHIEEFNNRYRDPFDVDLRIPPSVRHFHISKSHMGTLHIADAHLRSLCMPHCRASAINGFATQSELEDLYISRLNMAKEELRHLTFEALHNLKRVTFQRMPELIVPLLQQAGNMPHIEEVYFDTFAGHDLGERERLDYIDWLHMLRAPCRLKLVPGPVTTQEMQTLAQKAKGEIAQWSC